MTRQRKKRDDTLDDLELMRKVLEENLEACSRKAAGEGRELMLWSGIGTVLIALDVSVTGGAVCGGFAAFSAVETLHQKRRAKALKNDLCEVKKDIIRIKENRLQAQIERAARAEPALKEQFSPAAQAEIDGLRKQLEKLQGRVESLQERRTTLDKPRFRPPSGS